MQVRFLGQEDLLEKEMATHSSYFAWVIPWERSLAGFSLWGLNESDTTEQTRTHACTHTPPGDPVVRTPCFHAMDPGTIPGWGI